LIIDEAQNLDLTELQTVLTRPHDSVKVVVIGSSLQNDNFTAKKYGPDKLLAFQLYIQHFVEQSEINIKNIVLTKNYRGRFANFADQIMETVTRVSETEDQKMNRFLEGLLKKEAKMETTLYSETTSIDLETGAVSFGSGTGFDNDL